MLNENPSTTALKLYFREAVYVLRFASEEDRRVGKGPTRLDHVSGELHQERSKTVGLHSPIELNV